jgi:hypothetical protein
MHGQQNIKFFIVTIIIIVIIYNPAAFQGILKCRLYSEKQFPPLMKTDEKYADTVLRNVERRRGIAVGNGRKAAARTRQTENLSEKYNILCSTNIKLLSQMKGYSINCIFF